MRSNFKGLVADQAWTPLHFGIEFVRRAKEYVNSGRLEI